jgi:hypothetical protein
MTPIMLVDGASFPEPAKQKAGVQVPSIRLDTTHLFYLLNLDTVDLSTNTTTTTGYLMRVPLKGGTPQHLASIPEGGDPGPELNHPLIKHRTIRV